MWFWKKKRSPNNDETGTDVALTKKDLWHLQSIEERNWRQKARGKWIQEGTKIQSTFTTLQPVDGEMIFWDTIFEE